MVEYWFPYAGHPDGETDVPWFRVEDGHGYRTDDNPAGPSNSPCFGVIDGWAYPAVSLPGTEPTFQVVASFVYAPQGTAWFRIGRAPR
jgi:hypothetical protein